jgi:DNA-binding NtrC family response regulator
VVFTTPFRRFQPIRKGFDVESKVFDLLLVDDDADFRDAVARRFTRHGLRVQQAANAESALGELERRRFDVALVDMVMPGINGIELLKRIRSATPECEVVLLTGQGTIELAVEAMKAGAYDFITKPFPLAELEVLIEKACERSQLGKENVQLKAALERVQPAGEIVGSSPAMQEVFRIIERAGPSDKAILIEGESGTGKELVARALHRASPRAARPLVTINCAALPESLLESELFGHEKGAFTGAVSSKPGLFEVADGGTMFIDEIGEMPGALQAKLLRVLEDGSMRRVGSIRERRVDVRILAATNRDMQAQVAAGKFREDLFYRINVMSLKLPPLRERAGDVRLLIEKFLGAGWSISPDAAGAMEAFSWPGNVRQLINALDRAKIMADGNLIRSSDLPAEVVGRTSAPRVSERVGFAEVNDGAGLSDALASVQRSHIVDILRRERGNKARTARALGINRRSLYRLLEKHRIEPAEATGDGAKVPSIS